METRCMRRGVNCEGLLALIETLPGERLTMVEVGSYAGESADLWAGSGKFSEIHCVDSWAFVGADQVEPRFQAVAGRWPRLIRTHRMPSVTAARVFRQAGQKIDLVYIDASHRYEAVAADIAAWLPLVRRPGWIAGHDFGGKFPGVIRAVHERFDKPFRVFEDSSWLVKLK